MPSKKDFGDEDEGSSNKPEKVKTQDAETAENIRLFGGPDKV